MLETRIYVGESLIDILCVRNNLDVIKCDIMDIEGISNHMLVYIL